MNASIFNEVKEETALRNADKYLLFPAFKKDLMMSPTKRNCRPEKNYGNNLSSMKGKQMTQDVLGQIAELGNMDILELKEKWRILFSTEPPRYNRPFIVKRLAYRIQELAFGGLPDASLTKMETLLDEAGCDDLGRLPQHKNNNAPPPVTGTRFIRHWHGEEHEVLAMAEGYEYRGRKYKSLSAIAREITGVRWSGPAFFGLRDHAPDNKRKEEKK